MNFQNLSCAPRIGNTNPGNCNLNLKNAVALLFTPAGTSIAVSELDDFMTTADTNLHEDSKYKRWYLVKGIKGVEKNNIEASVQTWGDGSTVETRDERVGRSYQFDNLCLFTLLSSFKGLHDLFDVWVIYAGNVIQGTKGPLLDGEETVSGFDPSILNVSQYDEAMNETQAMFTAGFQLATAEEWRNMVVFQPTNGILVKDLSGLQTINLQWIKQDPHVPGTYHISARVSCGSTNMGEVFPTELASIALWKAVDAKTKIEITISGVTVSPLGNFIIALSTVDPEYTAATHIQISTVAPSALAAANLEWYESEPVTVPK